ncbi:hypothetical protein Hanom_Chr03g00260801 [Helianthus anomalus]
MNIHVYIYTQVIVYAFCNLQQLLTLITGSNSRLPFLTSFYSFTLSVCINTALNQGHSRQFHPPTFLTPNPVTTYPHRHHRHDLHRHHFCPHQRQICI